MPVLLEPLLGWLSRYPGKAEADYLEQFFQEAFRFLHLIQDILRKKKATLHDFQVFTCKSMVPSRGFSVHLYAVSLNVAAPHHFICMTRELKEDLVV